MPVVTTMNGFDTVAQDNPQFIARIGTVANRAGNFALQNADLVLTIGSRNNIRQVSYNWENFAKNAKLVCVDIDGAELDKPTLKPALKIQADARGRRAAINSFLSSRMGAVKSAGVSNGAVKPDSAVSSTWAACTSNGTSNHTGPIRPWVAK